MVTLLCTQDGSTLAHFAVSSPNAAEVLEVLIEAGIPCDKPDEVCSIHVLIDPLT